ncbi:hypothetical protein M9458_016615, partial [Cirrhinus mrigala]
DMTLDPDTAHPNLILSDDGKQVRHGDIKQNLPNNSERFYFEVQVERKTGWILGVARESINRKGPIAVSPKDGLWTVGLWNGNEYRAHAGPGKPQKVGVFVDYEEGLVSFYDV